MKVKMMPSLAQVENGESGIHTIVRKYHEHGPRFGIEFTDGNDFELLAVHAGTTDSLPSGVPVVAHTHGLYFNGDYDMPSWSHKANKNVVNSVRAAKITTVPSVWVGKLFARNMRFWPVVLPHGIDTESWKHNHDVGRYVVSYAKNRDGVDVCDSTMSTNLAAAIPDMRFVQTFAKEHVTPNVKVTGVMNHELYKRTIQSALVYVSPVKETFGIAAIEAMMAGVPVLTANVGEVPNLIRNGVAGYCYEPGNLDDMIVGLEYCLRYREELSENAIKLASVYTWDNVMSKLNGIYQLALRPESNDVAIIIPVYNKDISDFRRAVDSAVNQTVSAKEIVVVDDGSKSDLSSQYKEICVEHNVTYYKQENAGVAHARNKGISISDTQFVICLDSDDYIDERFIEALLPSMIADRSLGIAYTGLVTIIPGKEPRMSAWPGDQDFDVALLGSNQVPTCCMFRREMWERLGGYRQRYAPDGAGEEDAEFWLRAGAYGWRAEKVTSEGLFYYSFRTGIVSGNKYHEKTDYLGMHPWANGGVQPFASMASPVHYSHPVYQVDEPDVCVVVPVGKNHIDHLLNALDSIDAQTYFNHEAVVVFDGDVGNNTASYYKKAFPHFRFYSIEESGAGAARNFGVAMSDADFILFLDADDTLYPEAIEKMVARWNETGMGVYSDYVGKSFVEDLNSLAPDLRERVVSYNEETKKCIALHHAGQFRVDWAMNMKDAPASDIYLWNNVTTLIPKAWHEEIGGFDETMPSWEDIDYWWRMAWKGHEFTRIEEPLMVYRFYTGSRRDIGVEMSRELVGYMRSKA